MGRCRSFVPNDLLAFIDGQPLGIALAILVIAGFLRGWIVPGYIYTAQVSRSEKLLDSITTITAAVDRLTDEIRARRQR